MAHKVILISDAGIDGAFALTLALLDPNLEVLGLAASAGNVGPEQATRNLHIIVEQLDPARWPRLGAAPQVAYDVDATNLHGPRGLGNVDFPCAQLHHPHPSDKLISDLVHQYPREVTVVVLGPATVFARTLDLHPDLVPLVHRLVVVGGSWHEPGDASAAAEFHFFCDPAAARKLLNCGIPLTLLPLDVTRKLILAPADLLQLPSPESRACRFLRKIIPHGIGASSSLFGVEGFFLHDLLGLLAVVQPGSVSLRRVAVDVETRGELTRGMSVFDTRWSCPSKPNVEAAVGVDVQAARAYTHDLLENAL